MPPRQSQTLPLILLSILLHCSTSKLRLIEPTWLSLKFGETDSQGLIKTTVSTFGEIPLDTETNVQIIMPPKNNEYGCKDLEKPEDLLAKHFVWLVKRGVCTYLKKASNAQLSGAYSVIVVHNQPHIDINNIIPYADTHFRRVHTPVILVSKEDGNQLINAVREGDTPIAVLSVEMTGAETKVVDTEFWLSPSSLESYSLLLSLEKDLAELGKFVEFAPKYKFHDLRLKNYPHKFLENHCYGNGRFCSIEGHQIQPKSVLDEALRQICIWKEHKRRNPEKRRFWKYIGSYKMCLEGFKFSHERELDCHKSAYLHSGIENAFIIAVDKCIKESFEPNKTKEESKNSLLLENENDFEYSDVYLVPSFFVNGSLLKEEISDKSMVRAMCDKLIDKPAYCSQFVIGRHYAPSKTSSIISIIFYLGMFAVLCMIVILVLFRRSLNKRVDREIYSEINEHISNYMRINN